MENLSPELIRNFKLIQDLDSRVRDILIEIDNLKENYLKNFKSYDQETRLTKIKDIEDKYETSKQFSDEKVQLANKKKFLIKLFYKMHIQLYLILLRVLLSIISAAIFMLSGLYCNSLRTYLRLLSVY